MEKVNYYILVDTYTDAMAIQDCLREGAVPSRISPTPYAIKHIAGCGVTVLLLPEHLAAAKSRIEAQHLPYVEIVPLECQINPRRDKFV